MHEMASVASSQINSSQYSESYGGKGNISRASDEETTTRDEYEEPVPLYSAESNVLEIMERYSDVEVPRSFKDQSHFKIYLIFEDRRIPFKVPNPFVLPRRKHCTVWPFEIKQALGFAGTMQELWIEPNHFIPLNAPSKALSENVFFTASARLGGAVSINATLLRPGFEYEVVCDDKRSAMKEDLTEDELEQISEIFEQFDADGDGNVSRYEMEEMCRQRVQERKELIEEKFQELVDDETYSEEDIKMAEESKQLHLQHLHDALEKLISMFEAADVNKDGTLSFEEFVLAEAWWMRCTLNPEHAHLF